MFTNTKSINIKNIKKKYVIFIFSIFLISFGALISHLLTIKYYEDIDNKVLQHLSDEFINKTSEIDLIIKKIEDIEDMIGVDINDLDEENLALPNRIDHLKTKVGMLFQRTKMKDSIPKGNPLRDIYITDNYGVRFHPILKRKQFHRGIDLRAKVGTEVYATASGVVRAL